MLKTSYSRHFLFGVCLFAAPAFVLAESIPDDSIVLSRGGVAVTVGDLRARMHQIPEEHRAGFLANRTRLDTLLRQLLEAQQIAAQARKDGLDQSERFKAEMRLGEINLLALLWNEKVQREAIRTANVEQIARERYLANPPRSPDTIEARHILIPFGTDEAAARARADELHRRVAAGESIEELARLHSADRSGANGGLITGPAEAFVPEFRAAVEALDAPGALAPVTRTEYGFHVITLVAKRPGSVRPFEEVREELMKEVSESVGRRAVTQRHERLFAGDIEFNEETMDRLLEDPSFIIPKAGD